MDAVAWAAPTDEQRELAAAIAELAAARCDSAHRRQVAETDSFWDRALWQTLAVEMGLAGIAVAEEHGGAGGSFLDAAVVVEESARALLPVPVTGHLAAAETLRAVADGTGGPVAAVLAEIASGERIAALAVAGSPGKATRVLHGDAAAWFVITDENGLLLVRREEPDVVVQGRRSLDLTRPYAEVEFDPSARHAVGDAAIARRAVEVLRVCLAVEAVGVGRACLDATVSYLKMREQFGRPIGSFQALQHRTADLAVALEAAVSCARYAASVVAAGRDGDEELATVGPLAKSLCADAAWRIAAESIQMHGGIGFTWEHDAHLYFKRATALRALLGSPPQHRRLVAERAGLAASGEARGAR